MIVRSQDRKSITSDLNFKIIEDEYEHTYEVFNGSVGTMGVYSTEEKAIRVISMIQTAYERYSLFSITYTDGLVQNLERIFSLDGVRQVMGFAFQMPDDEDVEV